MLREYLKAHSTVNELLQIEIVKQPDGTGLLRCTREDGSVTWQKQTRHAAHFGLHDLTHYAVETALGYRRGFFGLIAEGWEVDDTTGKGARGAVPDEAIEVERIVGLFDAERSSGVPLSRDEFNKFAPRALTEAEVQSVRALHSALVRQWFAIQPGQKLELTFEPVSAQSARTPTSTG